MKKVSIVLHQSYLEDSIKKLHELGLIQILNIQKEERIQDETGETVDVPPEVAMYNALEVRLTKLIDILSRVKSSPKGLKTILHPESPEVKTMNNQSAQEIYSDVEHILQTTENSIVELDETIKQLKEKKAKNEELEQQLSLLTEFAIDLDDLKDSPLVVVTTGRTKQFDQLEKQIEPQDEITIFSKEYGSGKKKEWMVLLTAHVSEKEKIDRLSREYLTVFDFKALSGSPTDALEQIRQNHTIIEDEIQNITKSLQTKATEHLSAFYALREEVQIQRARKEIMKNFTHTQTTYIIKGWALEKNQEAITTVLDTTCEGYCSMSFDTPSSNPDNPPTYLEIPKWAATFRTFLEMFALPKYHEINPTIFMGIFFIIFFGFMLGDAGYGLVILLLSLAGYLKLGKHSPLIKNWGFLGIWLGVSTTIAGLLLNSFFGDFIPRFIYQDPTRPLYSITIAGIHLPLDALGDPLTILTIALVFGLIHLNLGIVLGLIQAMKQKNFTMFLTQYFSWIPLQIGGGTLIGVFILRWEVSTLMMYGAALLTIIGILLLFKHAGPIGFFGITGYVGDWLSYARLLALGLATSGMALAFNVVGELIPTLVPVVGIILLPVILVLAHTANLGIQALGAGVHSLRLQYVEFFNRFYEGGGEEFDPFHMKRTYTRVEK
jgi:V/A-type H+/Na+-transporting ATPase subunit I